MHNLYEFGSLLRFGTFSDDLFNNGVYFSTGISMLAITLLGMTLFYVIKKHKPLTFRLTMWFIFIFVIGLINFGIAYSLSYSTLDGVYSEQNQNLPYGFGSFAGFGLINIIYSIIFCFFISLAIQLFFKKTHGDIPIPIRKSFK